ncbi:uncharacterized protein LOC119319576 [Triticum dicoccoides]|uniref:uncharacterized protein LOC119319576 n=1 Tax=Triticum dicoccoides TaxID=85692 RepID=UPI0018917406|nr:uncharacterized protein LOC119319576 [Triticum dicoccoides]
MITSWEFTPMFSVEFEHNGLFCGLGAIRQYVGCTHVFDYCHPDSLSTQVMKDCLEKIGYDTLDPKMCLPENKSIFDGMICVDNDEVIAAINAPSREHKTLYLLVDEKDHIWYDVVIELPTRARRGEGTSRINAATNIEEQEQHPEQEQAEPEVAEQAHEVEGEVEETDSEFYESDYDVEDGDNDLFDENVDKNVEDNNVQNEYMEEGYPPDEDDLILSKEELQKLKYTFRTFSAEIDMDNPVFRVGLVFSDMKEVRRVLDAYSVKETELRSGELEMWRLG